MRRESVFEGVFRRHMIVKGRNRDPAWCAMLDRDWPQVKANFDRHVGAEAGVLSLPALNASGATTGDAAGGAR